jgi:long-chain acyl-CoA synthetase
VGETSLVGDPARRDELVLKGLTLTWWAEEIADNPAIVSDHGSRTFAELEARTNQLIRALRSRGLSDGDSVALICTNRPEFAETVAACARAGFRLTPINTHLTAEEAGYIVDDCEAKALLADSRLREMALGALDAAPAVKVRLAIGDEINGFDSYTDALDAESSVVIEDPAPGTQMLYTSGTTGRPKGVHRPPATGESRTSTDATAVNLLGYQPGDMHLCTGPLYHAAPLAFSLSMPIAFGAGVVLMDGWDAEEALRLIERHRVTHTHMVPTMFHRLLTLPDDARSRHDVASLRSVLHGAAPCPVEEKKALIDWLGPIVTEYYAATEGLGSFVDSNTWLTRPGTVGKPFIPDQVRIGDDDGNALAAGEVGLVYLKAPATGRFEYYKDGDKTSGSYRGDYFTLGDMGYMDADGFLFLTDRTANLIISGGVNIYPAEVDAVLLQHPAVGDAATIGVPNDEWGEEVKAVVELQPGAEPTTDLSEELIAFCRERLAHYKCPRTIDFVEALPRQDNGKIYKRLLRDHYRQQRQGV